MSNSEDCQVAPLIRCDNITNQKLAFALHHIKRGLRVFRLEAGRKEPFWLSHKREATTDESQIRRWWDDPEGCQCNIGIVTDGLLVVDPDVHGGKDGLGELTKLEDENSPLPPTLTAKTGSGGKHLFFRPSTPTRTRNQLRPGLDVLGSGAYVVGVGSNVRQPDGSLGNYAWECVAPIAAAPAWLENLVGEARDGAEENAEAWLPVPVGMGFDDLSEELRSRFVEDLAADEKLRTIWAGQKDEGDTSWSGHVMSLAVETKKRDYPREDFLGLASAFDALPRKYEDGDLERQLNRAWDRATGEPLNRSNPADEFEPIEGDSVASWGELEEIQQAERARKEAEIERLNMLDDAPALSAADWNLTAVPAREWLIQDWLPVGCTTLFAGDGGTGKSLIAQQMATAIATGHDFLGVKTQQAGVLGIFCEDDEAELQRRQIAINAATFTEQNTLTDLRIRSRYGLQNVMATFDRDGLIKLTKFFEGVRKTALRTNSRLIVLDNISFLWTGDEVNRHQVTDFVNSLNRLAVDINGAVLLLGHIAKAEGSQYSGSTAWNNAVRSRLFLSRPKVRGEADERKKRDRRVITRSKANYAGHGEATDVVWRNGVFDLAPDRIEISDEADLAEFIIRKMGEAARVTQQEILWSVAEWRGVKESRARDLIKEAVPETQEGRIVNVDGTIYRVKRVRAGNTDNGPLDIVREHIGAVN